MRKYTLYLILFFISFSANAQLQIGGIAPDFTLTDINGDSHTLSNYLSQGKKVILNFASPGCGPCWSYRRSEALDDLYKAFGPLGSDEIIILDIYSGYTTINELNGVSNPPPFGNWLLNTSHPSIITSSLDIMYQINYNPLVYGICSDGIIKCRGTYSALGFYTNLFSCNNTMIGVQNYVEALDTENGFCSTSGSFVAKIKNLGKNFVTSCTLNLKENGIVIGSKNFTGAIGQFSSSEIIFDEIPIVPSASYSYEIVNVNGQNNHVPSFSTADLRFHMSNQTAINIEVKTHTYSCPGNMTWKIKDETGATVITGGPYPSVIEPCGGLNANTVISENFTLPNANGCYSLELLSSSPYGWKDYFGNAPQPTASGIEIFSGTSLIYSKMYVENFGSSLEIKNVIKTNSLTISDLVTAVEDTTILHPNPTNGMFTIKTNADYDDYSLTFYTIEGKFIAPGYKQINSKEFEINLDGFASGLYFINLYDKSKNTNELLKVFKK